MMRRFIKIEADPKQSLTGHLLIQRIGGRDPPVLEITMDGRMVHLIISKVLRMAEMITTHELDLNLQIVDRASLARIGSHHGKTK